MSSLPLAGCAVTFFLASVAGAILLAPNNALKGRGNAALPMSLKVGPILQLELARDEKDIREIIMTGDINRNIHDARLGNMWDSALFIPAYAGLLISLGLILARVEPRYGRWIAVMAVTAVPVAAICDWQENLGILQTLDHIANGGRPHQGDAQLIAYPSLIKWTLLAITLLAYGAAAVRQSTQWVRFALGPLLLAPGVLFIILLVQRYAVRN